MVKVLLQVSIGSLDSDTALKCASEAFLSGADAIEVSNTLLKRHGFNIVSEIRRVLPKVRIYVDTKTIEALEEELRLAYNSGADVISVSSLISEDYLLSALSYLRKYGLEISLDLSGVKDASQKILELSYLTPNYFYLKLKNTGSDLSASYRKIKELVRLSPAPIIIGGIREASMIGMLVRLGVSIVSIEVDRNNLNSLQELVKEARATLDIAFP